MLLSYAIFYIYLFYDGAVDMQIWGLICHKSLILGWPLRPVGVGSCDQGWIASLCTENVWHFG